MIQGMLNVRMNKCFIRHEGQKQPLPMAQALEIGLRSELYIQFSLETRRGRPR